MKIKTLCSLTIIPTLILILLLIASVDNYIPETQIYGQTILGEHGDNEFQYKTIEIILKDNSMLASAI
jgi:hypothetical protein